MIQHRIIDEVSHHLQLLIDIVIDADRLLAHVDRHAGRRRVLATRRAGQGENEVRRSQHEGVRIEHRGRDHVPGERLACHQSGGKRLAGWRWRHKDGTGVVAVRVLRSGKHAAEVAGPLGVRNRRRKDLRALADSAPLFVEEEKGLALIGVVVVGNVEGASQVPAENVEFQRRLRGAGLIGKEVGRVERVVAEEFVRFTVETLRAGFQSHVDRGR